METRQTRYKRKRLDLKINADEFSGLVIKTDDQFCDSYQGSPGKKGPKGTTGKRGEKVHLSAGILTLSCLLVTSLETNGESISHLFQGLPGSTGVAGISGLPGAKGISGPPGYRGTVGSYGSDVSSGCSVV